MDWIREPERKTPVVADVDVLVCGGGIAGVSAAISAARYGVKVMLLEKYGFLGGLVTTSLVITTPPLNNGINLEFGKRLKEKAVYAPCLHSDEITKPLKLHAIDPEIVKYEFVGMLREAGVEILLHTYIVGNIMNGDTVSGIVMENKAGRQAVKAKILVDATGDADVAAFAGAPFRLVKKPMTMMFNMVGVDVGEALNAFGNWGGIRKLLKDAIDKGDLEFELGLDREFGAPGVYAEDLVYKDEINVWSGNLMGMNGVDPKDLTQAEFITREHTMRMAAFLKENAPGFEKARIEYTSTQVGVRATRQIIGEAMPTKDEIQNKVFDDTVVKPYARNEMRLPLGSILPQKTDNLLVAGRCISADEEAMGKLRLIPVCTATGQAAGTAAALAVKQNISPRKLDITMLQKNLANQGMDLGLP
jgi:glycine/D-amino acid oxidase-like deaminating enzyme